MAMILACRMNSASMPVRRIGDDVVNLSDGRQEVGSRRKVTADDLATCVPTASLIRPSPSAGSHVRPGKESTRKRAEIAQSGVNRCRCLDDGCHHLQGHER